MTVPCGLMMFIMSFICFVAGCTLFLSIFVIAFGTVGTVGGLLVVLGVLRLIAEPRTDASASAHNVHVAKHNSKKTSPFLEFI
jgi:hypothetical protein